MPASYPTSIKSFLTYYDQPADPTKVDPITGIDLTIDRAMVTNEIHDEVLAMERNIGVGAQATIVIPGIRTMGGEINALFNGKANGRVDPANNAIYPLQLPTHNHTHAEMSGRGADDHPQYMRVDGARGFSAPCAGQPATAANQLTTLGQVQGQGWLNYNQVEFAIWVTVTENRPHLCQGFPGLQRYRMTGGFFGGQTDVNGLVRIDYSSAQFHGILSLVYMKMPFPGPSAYGYTFQYEEDQLVLLEVDNSGATIQFIEDIVVDRQAYVAMCWMVVGV